MRNWKAKEKSKTKKQDYNNSWKKKIKGLHKSYDASNKKQTGLKNF